MAAPSLLRVPRKPIRRGTPGPDRRPLNLPGGSAPPPTPGTWRRGPGAARRAPCTVGRAPCALRCTPCTVRCAPGGVHRAPCTVHCAPCAARQEVCTGRRAPCTVRSAPCAARQKVCTGHCASGGAHRATASTVRAACSRRGPHSRLAEKQTPGPTSRSLPFHAVAISDVWNVSCVCGPPPSRCCSPAFLRPGLNIRLPVYPSRANM